MTNSNKVFQDGGKLRENALYIEREADRLLYEYLLAGEYCSILDPRQVGKSSLMERTSKRLTEAGVRCGYVDLQSFANADITFDKLIFSLVFTISRSLGIETDSIAFLKKYNSLSANKVLEQFFREIVFPTIDSKIVLFIDEVDIVKSFKDLPDTLGGTKDSSGEIEITDKSSIGDSFFLTFRSLHESRTSAPFDRLAICFAGVAFPADLVNRPEISPFNVGKRLSLSDFTFEEMQEFRQGISGINAPPDEIIEEVFKWTDGHPYMTQKILADLTKANFDGANVSDKVAERVDQLFLLPNISPDANLAYAVKRLTSVNESEAAKKRRPQILETFLRIKRSEGKKIPLERDLIDNETPSFDESRLFGLLKIVHEPDGNYLKVRNLIYDKFFSDEWLTKQLNDQREFRPFFERWMKFGKIDDYLLRGSALEAAVNWAAGREDITLEEREFINKSQKFNQKQLLIASEARRAKTFRTAAVLSGVLALIAVGLFGIAYNQTRIADRKRTEAYNASLLAQEKSNLAEERQQYAETQTKFAEDKSKEADNERAEAEKQKGIAENKTLIAEQQLTLTKRQTDIAIKERAEAQRQTQIAQQERSEAQKQTNIAVQAREDAEVAEAAARYAENRAVTAEKRTDIYSRIILRQERSTEAKYREEQQSAFRKDAENMAVELRNLGSNTSINVGSVLPRAITNTKSYEKDVNQLKEGRSETYAGELTTGKKTVNYFADVARFSSITPQDQRYLTFWAQNDANSSLRYILPRVLYLDGYTGSNSFISPLGNYMFVGGFENSFLLDKEKQLTDLDSFKFNDKEPLKSGVQIPDSPRRTITKVFQSKRNSSKAALLQPGYYAGQPNGLLLFDDKVGIYGSLQGDYFIKSTDEDILYQENGNLKTVNIITGAQDDLSLKSNDAVEQEDQLYVPLYDEKNHNLAVLKLYATSSNREVKALLNVFDISKKETLISNHNFGDENLFSEESRYIRDDFNKIIYFSPDGKYLLYLKDVANADGNNKTELKALKISDYEKNKKAKLVKANSFINEVFTLPDGKRLALWETTFDSNDNAKNCINIYNWKDLDDSDASKNAPVPCDISLQNDFRSSNFSTMTLFTADSKSYLLIGGEDGILKALDLEARKVVFNEKVSPAGITKIVVNDNELSITSPRGVFSRMSYENGAFRVQGKFDLKDYTINSAVNIKVSPKSEKFADFSGKSIRIWNKEGKMVKQKTLAEDIKSIEYSPNGKGVLAASNRQAFLWNPETNNPEVDIAKPLIDKLTDDKKASAQSSSISFSGSGKYALAEFKTGYAVYDVEAGKPYRSELFSVPADKNNSGIVPTYYSGSDSYQAWGVNKFPLGSPTRFSPNDKYLIVVSELNRDEQLVKDIFKSELDDYLKFNSATTNIVRIIDLESGEVLKQFFIGNFKYAKFSSDDSMVALFTTTGQCFIAHTGKFESTQALLIPLENVAFGDFSKNGDKFVTVINMNAGKNKVVHVFDTESGSLSHKDNILLPNVAGEEKGVPIGQEIYFVKFSEENNDEIEIGRGVTFSIRKPVESKLVDSSTQVANVSSSNSNKPTEFVSANANMITSTVLVPSRVKTQLSSNTQSEKYTQYDCYRINLSGMLVAESRCGLSKDK